VFCFEIDRNVAVALQPPAFPVGRYVFVAAQPLAMNGITGADAQCQADATAAGLAGTYRAILATTTESASTHVGGFAEIWRRPDGIVVARTGLDQAALLAAPDTTAAGAPQPQITAFLGAASATALGDATTTCNDWTSTVTAGTQDVIYGNGLTMLGVVGGGTSMCNQNLSVVCAQM